MSGICRTLSAAAAVLLLAGTAPRRNVPISSSSFKDGASLPKKMGAATKPIRLCGRQCCGVVVEQRARRDDELRAGHDRSQRPWHWCRSLDRLWHPASITSFAEGETSKPSDKYIAGIGTAKQSIYMGPCTPPGPPHHYTFVLIATDLDPKALPAGLTKPELFDKLNGHVKGSTGIIGLFKARMTFSDLRMQSGGV